LHCPSLNRASARPSILPKMFHRWSDRPSILIPFKGGQHAAPQDPGSRRPCKNAKSSQQMAGENHRSSGLLAPLSTSGSTEVYKLKKFIEDHVLGAYKLWQHLRIDASAAAMWRGLPIRQCAGVFFEKACFQNLNAL